MNRAHARSNHLRAARLRLEQIGNSFGGRTPKPISDLFKIPFWIRAIDAEQQFGTHHESGVPDDTRSREMRQSKFVVRGVCAVGVVPVVALSMVLSGCAMDAADTGAEDLGTQHEELTLAGAGEVGEFTHLNNQNIA